MPDRPAIICGPTTRTYAEFADRARRFATWLDAVGVGPGDAVAIDMPNAPEYLEVFFAALLVGASPANVNYRYLAPEVREILMDAGATFVVCGPEQHPAVAAACADCTPPPAILRTGADYEDVLATTEPAQLHHAPSGDDIVLIYTGGTTGRPKGAMWRVEDMYRAFWESTRPGKPMVDPVDAVRAGKRAATLLPASPLMHGTALFTALGTLCGGGTLVLVDTPGLDAARIWDAVARETAQTLVIVGDAFARPLLDALDATPDRWDLTRLTAIVSSGVTWSAGVKRALLAHLPRVVLIDSLGSTEGLITRTETTATDTIIPARFAINDRMRVLDGTDRDVVPGSGAVGRIAVARHVPVGYRNDPEQSARTFRTIDGVRYAIPGDLATVETDGTITLLGRGSACINTGGEKVFPEEVEHVLRDHPRVRDVLIVGLPDARFGEIVAAVVVAEPADAAALDAWCRARLAPYKVPRRYAFVADLGRSAAGKADYARLRALAAEQAVLPSATRLHSQDPKKEFPVAEIPSVDVRTAQAAQVDGALILDVREPDEWAAGHALGALWIPMGEVTERHGELPTDTDIYVICRSGGRSATVTEALNAWGYTATNIIGGSTAWAAEGLPFIDDDGNPGSVA